jgi:hypothetical protein
MSHLSPDVRHFSIRHHFDGGDHCNKRDRRNSVTFSSNPVSLSDA